MGLQFSLPRRRRVAGSGIQRAPRREWPRHRKFVRSFACVFPKCDTGAPVVFCHIRSAANAGTGLKPHDAFGYPGCTEHHDEQHRIGQVAFERKYGIDLGAIAAELVRQSPDRAMRESLALVGIDR